MNLIMDTVPRISFLVNNVTLQQVTQIDADLKVKSQSYNSLKGNLQNLERKATYVLVCFCN